MGNTVYFILSILFLVILVLAIRLFGAWMLRIDEIIKQQKLILDEIKRLTKGNINM